MSEHERLKRHNKKLIRALVVILSDWWPLVYERTSRQTVIRQGREFRAAIANQEFCEEGFLDNWKPMDTALDTGTEILVARFNGCSWDYYTVWMSHEAGFRVWRSEHTTYPLDHFSAWKELTPPYFVKDERYDA